MNFDQPQREAVLFDHGDEGRPEMATTARALCHTDNNEYEFLVNVYFAKDQNSDGICVVDVGRGLKGSEQAMSGLRELIGKSFPSRQDLNRYLNGNREDR
jgi:hypothetical protein